MNRTQIACYCLLASAFMLAGLLIVNVQRAQILPTAHADQVLAKGSLTIMTGRTGNSDESLFVLDNISQRLLIYRVKLTGRKGRIELARFVELDQLFSQTVAKGAGNGGGGRAPR